MNSIRLISWNVNGIRAAQKKGLWETILPIHPDIFCIQETKADADIMASGVAENPLYTLQYHSASNKKGYSGVANYVSCDMINSQSQLELTSTHIGIGDEYFDIEGRMVIQEFRSNSGTQYVIMNGYYPQGGRGPERIEYKIKFYKAVHTLAESYRNKGYYILLCGDFNTTVGDIDLARPKENRNTTGCLPQEREALNWFLGNGYTDTFRHFYPDKTDVYSYWDQITRARDRNVGWRIDYWIVSDNVIEDVKDAFIWMDKIGSDHAPVGIDITIR